MGKVSLREGRGEEEENSFLERIISQKEEE